MKQEYIKEFDKLMKECTDVMILDSIFKILTKAGEM